MAAFGGRVMAVEKPGGSEAPSAAATSPDPSTSTDTAPAKTIRTQTLSRRVQSRAPARPQVIGSRPYRESSTAPPLRLGKRDRAIANQTRHQQDSYDGWPNEEQRLGSPIALMHSRGCERPGRLGSVPPSRLHAGAQAPRGAARSSASGPVRARQRTAAARESLPDHRGQRRYGAVCGSRRRDRHLDEVEHLGTSIELEAVAPPDSDLTHEHRLVAELRDALGSPTNASSLSATRSS